MQTAGGIATVPVLFLAGLGLLLAISIMLVGTGHGKITAETPIIRPRTVSIERSQWPRMQGNE